MRFLGRALIALLGAAGAASAQQTGPFDFRPVEPVEGVAVKFLGGDGDKSDWAKSDPGDANRDENPTAPDKARFWENFQDKALDLCQRADLAVRQELPVGDALSVEGRVSRSLGRYPTGKLALLDEFSPRAGVSYPVPLAEADEGIGAAIGFGARMLGQSVVIRPLETRSSCKALLRAANPISYKTVLPMRARRLMEMEVGELWKMSMSFQVGVEPKISAGYGPLTANLHWGKYTGDAENITLYRLAPDKLRFILRLDRATFTDKGGGIKASLTMGQLGLQLAEDLFSKLLGRTIGKELNKIMFAVADASNTRIGEQAMLEFLLNPGDEAQMETLARLLKGDLLSIKGLARMTLPQIGRDPADTAGRLARLEESQEKFLGLGASFAAANAYTRVSKNFHFMLPILYEHRSAKNRGEENIVILDDKQSRLHVYPAEKKTSDSFIAVPFFGKLIAHDRWRTAQVFTARDNAGKDPAPAFIYVQQEGLQRESAGTARDMVRRADEIMRYAGTRGYGVNPRTSLPVDLLPPAPDEGASEPGYRRGVTALSLVFSQKAVRSILAASVEEIVRSYANTLESSEGDLLRALLVFPTTRLGLDGRIDYDDRAIFRDLDREEQDQARGSLRSLAKTAAEILQDLNEARQALTAEKQAEAFRKILAGSGESGLAYEKILSVLIQLVDPMDIAAEFYARIDKHVKGEKDLNARYVLYKKASDDGSLVEMLNARKKFLPPTRLTD